MNKYNNSHNKLSRVLKNGGIKKTPCVVCGALKVVGHHPDYNFPLQVVWVCPKHHSQIHHGEINAREFEVSRGNYKALQLTPMDMKKEIYLYEIAGAGDKSIVLEVVATKRRNAFGRIDVMITPVAGSGEIWVNEVNLRKKKELST